jgi:hypothetical protein
MRERVDVAGSVERRLGVHLAAGQWKAVRCEKGGCARVKEGRVRVCATCVCASPGGRVCNLSRRPPLRVRVASRIRPRSVRRHAASDRTVNMALPSSLQ